MKSGKELTLTPTNKNFKVKCGAIANYKAPVSIYLKITSWLRVTKKVTNLNTLLKEYRIVLRQYLKTSDLVLKHFDYNTIIDVNISQTRVKLDKPTFFQLEFNFYQKNQDNRLPLVQPKRKDIPNLRPVVEQMLEEILALKLFTDHDHFSYQYLKLGEPELMEM